MVRMTYFGVIRLFTVFGLCQALSACGFHLQGQQPHASANTHMSNISTQLPVLIDAQTSKSAYALRLSLLKQLTRYDADAHIADTNDQQEQATLASLGVEAANRISIDDVSIQKYQLAGLLTEVRLTMTAKIRYHIHNHVHNHVHNVHDTSTTHDGTFTHHRTLMVERSYQYNQTSVSVEDLQRTQTEIELYHAMAQRIADQYIALSTLK